MSFDDTCESLMGMIAKEAHGLYKIGKLGIGSDPEIPKEQKRELDSGY